MALFPSFSAFSFTQEQLIALSCYTLLSNNPCQVSGGAGGTKGVCMSLKQNLAGRKVVLIVNASERRFDVLVGQEVVKAVGIKGLMGLPLPFEEYAARMVEEARSEYRRWLQQQRRLHQLRLWAS
jgi:hypothetical protein